MAASGIHKSQYAYDAEAEKSSKQWATQGMGLRRKPKGKVHVSLYTCTIKGPSGWSFSSHTYCTTTQCNSWRTHGHMIPRKLGVGQNPKEREQQVN